MKRIFLAILLGAVTGEAQQRQRAEIKVIGGRVDFIDSGHGVFGAAVRYYITPRVGIEPEVLYMIGPDSDRDITIIPHVSFDFRAGSAVRPYVIGGAGLLRHSDKFGSRKFSSNEWTGNAGGGLKIFLTPRLFVSPDFRLGFEPVLRVTGSIGFVF